MSERLFTILQDPAPGSALIREVGRDGLPELPFLNLAATIPAGPKEWHSGSVIQHLARCMTAVAGDPLAVWMALCHDCGKLTTPEALWPHHYGHEIRGALLAAVWAEGLPPEYREAGTLASLAHMRAPRYPAMKPGKSLKLLRTIFTSSYGPQLLRVVDADSRSRVSQLLISHWIQIAGLPEDRQLEKLCKLKAELRKATRPGVEGEKKGRATRE